MSDFTDLLTLDITIRHRTGGARGDYGKRAQTVTPITTKGAIQGRSSGELGPGEQTALAGLILFLAAGETIGQDDTVDVADGRTFSVAGRPNIVYDPTTSTAHHLEVPVDEVTQTN